MNPEDADEIVYAFLTHLDGDETIEEIDQAVRRQIAEYSFQADDSSSRLPDTAGEYQIEVLDLHLV